MGKTGQRAVQPALRVTNAHYRQGGSWSVRKNPVKKESRTQ